jgi:anti-sigma-K factor RskA
MDDDELTPEERAEIERVSDTLADPAVWAVPGPELQERVVAAIAEADSADVTRGPRRGVRYAVVGLAAAVLLAVGVAVGVQLNQDDRLQYAASLRGTDLAPEAIGEVTMTKTTSGWKIELQATGLPRRADGEFYEAWLKDDSGQLVPIGTFNDGHDVVLWAGVPPTAFPTLTVTREVADGNQASSGQVVLIGQTSRS